MKKFSSLVKFIVIESLWLYVFLSVCQFIFLHVWNFNLFSVADWKIINAFWNNGGTIKSATDFLFLTSFVLILIFGVWGGKKLYLLKFSEILQLPFEYYSRWELKRYGETSRIVIKNIGTTTENKNQNEVINKKLKELEKKLDNEKETTKIRETIAAKIDSNS